MKIRTWLMALSMFVVLAGAVPAKAAGVNGKGEADAKCPKTEQLLGIKSTGEGQPGLNCLRVEIVTTSATAADDVGVESVMRRTTACETSEGWGTVAGRRTVLLFRVRTCEWFYYNGIDLGDFQNPPTITVDVPAPACRLTGTATSGAYYTNDENNPILAWGEAYISCMTGWNIIPVPGEVFHIRHEIYPHADGTAG